MKLPALRMNLDFMPSPVDDHPGLLIRDPYQFSESALIIPPPLVEALRFFDGEHEGGDLGEWLTRQTGELDTQGIRDQLLETLSRAGFLLDEQYEAMRAARLDDFAQSDARLPSHAGSAYPMEEDALRAEFGAYLSEGAVEPPARAAKAIAAPHVSPEGGWRCYQSAYLAIPDEAAGRTFVILGTSHYGDGDKFGLTRKNFVTPLGEAQCDVEGVERLLAAAPAAVNMEDYCHAIEHSIEFQVLFLQHRFGPNVRILPILCGAYTRSVYRGGKPEQDHDIAAFLAALGELEAERGGELYWIVGIDLAHMGRRYGDPWAAQANLGPMADVAERDQSRIARVIEGDRDGFWELIQQNRDDLKWCGASPLYTFLSAVPHARGELLRYEQWNIDDQSVVTFSALSFS